MLKLMYNGNTVTCGGGFVSFPDPAHFVTLIQNTGGTIAADKTSGIPGDIVTLSNTPNAGYNFDNYSITGATLTGSQFEFGNSDVSAEGLFSRKAYTLTLQNDGHGTIGATKTTGYAGDTVTLSNSYNTYYRFNNYTQTGGSLNGSTFTFGNADATAKANFKVNYFTAKGNFEKGSNVSVAGKTGSKSAWNYSNVAEKYAVHQAHTGSIPTAWYATSNRWKPNNVSGYSMTMNAKLTFTAKKDKAYNGASAAMTGVTLVGSTQNQSQTFSVDSTAATTRSYSKTVTTTTQNVNYGVSARLGAAGYFAGGIARASTATYIANGTSGTWTATGIAP